MDGGDGSGEEGNLVETFAPGHWCYRPFCALEDRLELFYEVAGCAVAMYHAGMAAGDAVTEALRRAELRRVDGGNESEKWRVVSADVWEEHAVEAGGADVLLMAMAVSDREVYLFIESRSVEAGVTAPKFGPLTELLDKQSGSPDRDAIWTLSEDVHDSLPAEFFSRRELDIAQYVIRVGEAGSCRLMKLTALGKATPDQVRSARLHSVLRVSHLQTLAQAQENMAVIDLVQAVDTTGGEVAILSRLAADGMKEDVLKIIGPALNRLMYWVAMVGGEEKGVRLGHALEVMSHLSVAKSGLEMSRAFLASGRPPCVLLVAAEVGNPSRWEMSVIAEELLNRLRASCGWDVRLLTTSGPGEAQPQARVLRRSDGCEVVTCQSAHGVPQYVVRLSQALSDSTGDQRLSLSRHFATEALCAIKAEGIRPAAIYTCGWPTTMFAPDARQVEGLAEHFAETKLTHIVEPNDYEELIIDGEEDATVQALQASDNWGAIVVKAADLPRAVQDAAPTAAVEAFQTSFGHTVDRKHAIHGHITARKDLLTRFLSSHASEVRTVVLLGLYTSGRGKEQEKKMELLRAVEVALEEFPSRVVFVLVSEALRNHAERTEPRLVEIRRRHPSAVVVVPGECRQLALLGADFAVLCGGSAAMRNELFSMGTAVVDSSDDVLPKLRAMQGTKGTTPSMRESVMQETVPIDPVVALWSRELASYLRRLPLTQHADEKVEHQLWQKASWALHEGRLVRIEFSHLGAEQVFLYGSMNGWATGLQMSHNGDSRFKIKMRLPRGKHWYKFLVGGIWTTDPQSPQETDHDGFMNNYIIIDS